MRAGVIAEKVGMSAIFLKSGERVPVTLLKISDCEVVQVKNIEQDGYLAVQVGAKNAKVKNVTKPLKGHFSKYKVEPKSHMKEFRVSNDCLLASGTQITASHFVEGQYIDVQGKSIGKGTAGVMKRYGFAGLRASHGVSISHRSGGSTGQCQDPGRVPKGKKMAGHMGDKFRTTQNLKIVLIDHENNLIAVKGAVPGSKGSYLYVRDSIKKALPSNAPYPTFVQKETEHKQENVTNEEGASNES